MKNLYLYLITLVSIISLQSCEQNTTEDVSKVTVFAQFELAGNETIFINKGDAYVEPGATANEGGKSLPVKIVSKGLFKGGSLDTNVPDIYTVSYSAVNSDGFEASASRRVIVAETGDLKTNLSGLYKSTIKRNGSGGAQYTNIEYVLIWHNANGSFEFSDGIGGYYMYGRGYGVGYVAPGATFNVTSENNFTFGPNFTVKTFGGPAKLKEIVSNATAKTIDFKSEWDSGTAVYLFEIHLEQVQL